MLLYAVPGAKIVRVSRQPMGAPPARREDTANEARPSWALRGVCAFLVAAWVAAPALAHAEPDLPPVRAARLGGVGHAEPLRLAWSAGQPAAMRSPGLFGAGVALTAVGAGGSGVAVGLIAAGNPGAEGGFFNRQAVGLVVLVPSVLLLAGGLTMAILGSRAPAPGGGVRVGALTVMPLAGPGLVGTF